MSLCRAGRVCPIEVFPGVDFALKQMAAVAVGAVQHLLQYGAARFEAVQPGHGLLLHRFDHFRGAGRQPPPVALMGGTTVRAATVRLTSWKQM